MGSQPKRRHGTLGQGGGEGVGRKQIEKARGVKAKKGKKGC